LLQTCPSHFIVVFVVVVVVDVVLFAIFIIILFDILKHFHSSSPPSTSLFNPVLLLQSSFTLHEVLDPGSGYDNATSWFIDQKKRKKHLPLTSSSRLRACYETCRLCHYVEVMINYVGTTILDLHGISSKANYGHCRLWLPPGQQV